MSRTEAKTGFDSKSVREGWVWRSYRCSATQLASLGSDAYPRGTMQSPCAPLYCLSLSREANHLASFLAELALAFLKEEERFSLDCDESSSDESCLKPLGLCTEALATVDDCSSGAGSATGDTGARAERESTSALPPQPPTSVLAVVPVTTTGSGVARTTLWCGGRGLSNSICCDRNFSSNTRWICSRSSIACSSSGGMDGSP